MRSDFYIKNLVLRPRAMQFSRNILYRKLLHGTDIRSICEIGPGFGEFAHYCRNKGIRWIGIEPNDSLRSSLIEEGFEVHPAVLPEMPLLNASFDALFAAHVIEHMEGLSQALRFLETCKQLLLRGDAKYLVLLYPDILRCGHLFWHDYTHSFVTSRGRIEQMLHDEGWEICRSGHYAACFFRCSGLISRMGALASRAVFPRRLSEFLRLSIQQHGFTIAKYPRGR